MSIVKSIVGIILLTIAADACALDSPLAEIKVSPVLKNLSIEGMTKCLNELSDSDGGILKAADAVKRCLPDSYQESSKQAIGLTLKRFKHISDWALSSDTKVAVYFDLVDSSFGSILQKKKLSSEKPAVATLDVLIVLERSVAIELGRGRFDVAKRAMYSTMGLGKKDLVKMGRFIALVALFQPSLYAFSGSKINLKMIEKYYMRHAYCSYGPS